LLGGNELLYKNVAFIGDHSNALCHSNLNRLYIKTQGVIDVAGALPRQIMDSSAIDVRYLNIWSNVSRATNVFDFPVVTIRGSGGQFITTSNSVSVNAEARVIIYHNKYNAQPPNNGGMQPHHRAFVVGGTPKITGGSIPSVNAAWYQGNRPNNPIPNLDENAWIDFANNGGSAPANLAANYAGLPSVNRMTQAEWDGPWVAAAPARSGTQLAGAAGATVNEVTLPRRFRRCHRLNGEAQAA
jgi:hypothetical protein